MKPIVNMDIPLDGTEHKYILATTTDDVEVLVAKPIRQYDYHYKIVDEVERSGLSLYRIRGGWTRFDGERFQFYRESMDFGRADHNRADELVNSRLEELIRN